MSIIDLSHLFSTLYAGLKLGKEPITLAQNTRCAPIRTPSADTRRALMGEAPVDGWLCNAEARCGFPHDLPSLRASWR